MWPCMGIAADAALAAGGKVVGIIPEVFIAEQAHRLITELIEVPDLMARKRKMIEAGDAFLILPGRIRDTGRICRHRCPLPYLHGRNKSPAHYHREY